MANSDTIDGAGDVATLKQRRRPASTPEDGADPGRAAHADGKPLVIEKVGCAQAEGEASQKEAATSRKAVWSSGVAFYPPSRKYWRIGRKWYDFEPFLSKHPGGADILLLARDRFEDCTFAFEAHHHNYQKVRAIIRKYEVPEEKVVSDGLVRTPKESAAFSAAGAPSTPELLGDEAFYSVMRRRVAEYLRSVGCPGGGPTWQCCILFWATFCAWAASLALLYWSGSLVFTVFLGITMSWLGAFGHNWVHQPKYKFWAYLSLDVIGFSSDGWFREHVLQHHMYTNTPWDNHFRGTEPFLVSDPCMERNWFQKITPMLTPLILCFGLYANYLAHAVELLKGNEAFSIFKLCLPATVVAFVLRWGWWGFFLLFLSHALLGNYYFTLALMNHNAEQCVNVANRNKSRDWGVAQLHSSADWDVSCPFYLAGRWLWLNYHTVHHMFPLTDFCHHPAIQSILLKTCKEFQVSYKVGEFRKIHAEMRRTFRDPFSPMQEILVYAGGI
mmetsp:Transcript_121720/g.351424  ORF Transcript_121720/g.351424 Transcript_121720/m.351424 type:complete len:500 (-) Transcript_121720:61-1560(-)